MRVCIDFLGERAAWALSWACQVELNADADSCRFEITYIGMSD